MATLRWDRILALGIDMILLCLLWWGAKYLSDNSTTGLVIAIIFGCIISSLLEGFTGQSIGKMIMGVKIISTRFYKINVAITFPRNILKILLFPIAAIAYMLGSDEEVALHDKIMGTELIKI